MKVVHINAVYGVGSTGVIVEDIHNLCLRNGIESFVAYSTSKYKNEKIVGGIQIGKPFGKKMHAVLCRINGMQAYFSRFATKGLLFKLKEISPDIVVLHNLHSNYINLNMLLGFLSKENIKTVVVMHDCWYFTGGCFHYTADHCDKWLKGCGSCPKKMKDTPAYLFDRSAKILKDRKKYFNSIKDLTVVGVSEWISGEAEKTFFKGKTVTIHNGVDTNLFKPTPFDFKTKNGIEDKFIILGLASKWLSAVNKSTFNDVTAKLPNDCVVVLLGCKDEEKVNLPKNVIGLPFIKDREELIKIYSAADVFVNCTREDTLPFANIEPQACGTPVITYNNTGAAETVDNICGFSVENGNTGMIIEKIIHIKDVGKNHFTEKCTEWIKKEFCKEDNYKKYIDLFKLIFSR